MCSNYLATAPLNLSLNTAEGKGGWGRGGGGPLSEAAAGWRLESARTERTRADTTEDTAILADFLFFLETGTHTTRSINQSPKIINLARSLYLAQTQSWQDFCSAMLRIWPEPNKFVAATVVDNKIELVNYIELKSTYFFNMFLCPKIKLLLLLSRGIGKII